MANKNFLNLTHKDIECVLNREKNTNKELISAIVSIVGVVALFLGVLAGKLVLLSYGMGCLISLLGLISAAVGVISADNFNRRIIYGNSVLENIKSVVKKECPGIILEGKKINIVKGNTIDNFKKVDNSLLGNKKFIVGTKSTQYVLNSGKVCDDGSILIELLGAIEETVTGRVKHLPDEFKYKGEQVFDFSYKWVPASEVRPYDEEQGQHVIKHRK